MVRGAELVAGRWMREKPQSPEEIRDFYLHCSEYLFVVAYHNLMLDKWRNLLRLFKDEQGSRCLTFGGGIGSEAITLAASGNEVWYCDVPNSPVWKFAKWRAQNAKSPAPAGTGNNLPIHFSPDVPQDVKFDCVVAFNVFQILPGETLESSLRKIAASMKPAASLYCQNDFDGNLRAKPANVSQRSWDGRMAQHYNHTELWNSLFDELGLRKQSEQIYQKADQ